MDDEKRDDWDPLAPETLRDQRQAYDDLRDRCPVAHSPALGWSLFRHADIRRAAEDTDAFSNASPFPAIPNGMDPPEHGQYREGLSSHFEPDPMERLEPRARSICVDLLAPLCESGECEVIGSAAWPFAMRTQCAMLGWSEEQWQTLANWTRDSQKAAFNRDPESGKQLAIAFSTLVKSNLDECRASSATAASATTVLLQTKVNGKPLDDDQIVAALRNWIAGQGTVVAGLGNIMLCLAQDPGLQEQLRQEQSLIPAAIEEILRWNGPLVANRRTATGDVEIAGRRICRGESLALMWIAGNRDALAFEEAESVRIDRTLENSLVWGQGIHYCLGAPLARIEIRIALEELLSRTTTFSVASPEPVRSHYPGNGLDALHLRMETKG